MKLLIIEDEIDLADSIVDYFTTEGYVTECAHTYRQAYENIELYEYDCIIVDITLPDGNGLSLIEKLKADSTETGIIIISARQSTDDKIKGLDIGADDYLAKPFSLSELNARVKSIIRRRKFNGKKEFKWNELTLNAENRQLLVDNTEVNLTRKEYDLLVYFLSNKERILTKEAIVEHLWGDMMGLSADSLDFIYTHIRNLRKKLLSNGCRDYIKTIYGVGYKFTDSV